MAELVTQEIDYAETAPVRAEGRTVVTGTPAEVWAVLLDYPAWPTWFGGVKTCRSTSEPSTGVGSTREVVLGGGATVRERFVAWEHEAVWGFTATAMTPVSIFRSLVERVTIAELEPGRTRVTYRMAFEPALLLKPVAPLLARAMSANLTKAMRALDQRVQQTR